MALSHQELTNLFSTYSSMLYSSIHRDLNTNRYLSEHTKGLMPDTSRFDKSIIEPFPEKIGPAGFDLTIGHYIAESDILATSLTEIEFHEMNILYLQENKQYTLLPNKYGEKIYYISSYEKLNLPSSLELIVDARSTSGRLGCMCHKVGKMQTGEQIIAIQPFAFPITITSGKTSLAQAIVRYAWTKFIDYETLRNNHEKISFSRDNKDVFQESLDPNGLIITFSSNIIYRAKECKEPIDMDSPNEIDSSKYFELIKGNNAFNMDSHTLYLAGTREVIGLGDICGRISRESHISGTGLWSHFSGFAQPGFIGPLTLECYSLGRRRINNGEPAGFIIFDKVDGNMNIKYDGIYQHQSAPRLPKMFK